MFDDIQVFVNLMRKGDPLIIHDYKTKQLCEEQKVGCQAIENHVFYPTNSTMPVAWKGHGQTIFNGVKSAVVDIKGFQYDKRDLFQLSDGGQIYLDLKGNCFL